MQARITLVPNMQPFSNPSERTNAAILTPSERAHVREEM